MDNRVSSLEARVESRFNLLQSDMKDLNKILALEVALALLKDKVGM